MSQGRRAEKEKADKEKKEKVEKDPIFHSSGLTNFFLDLFVSYSF